MTKLLHYTRCGQGKPLLILHGLFGSSKNWQSLSRQFGEQFSVYTVDLRNHGSSFHDPVMNYDAIAEDVHCLVKHLEIGRCHVIGHSMGGKTAMVLARKFPDLVSRLVVADIAPLSYSHDHDSLINPILKISLDTVTSRADVDNALKPEIADPMLRGFLLQNLTRDENSWQWKVNWQAIDRQMQELTDFPEGESNWLIDIPTLFIRGENSDYIVADGIAAIDRHFSNASVETIEQAGHWLHAEQPQRFAELVSRFLA